MATIVVPRPQPTPPPLAPSLTLNTSSASGPVPVPNKHLPLCSPGSPPPVTPETPPASPPKNLSIQTSSILYPPDEFPIVNITPRVYSIDGEGLTAALDHLSSQPLPEAKQVFPWLHGLHADNQVQLAFFVARRKTLRRIPKCIRGVTIVKAGGDLSHSKLKGSIAPDELLPFGKAAENGFLEVDPKEGFSVRNFQIQAAKLAMLSDIVVYGDDTTSKEDVVRLAKRLSKAQVLWRSRNDPGGKDSLTFHTFVLSTPFKEFESSFPHLIAIGSNRQVTGKVMDFFQWERLEMCTMSKSSEISKNVWLGPTPEVTPDPRESSRSGDDVFDVLIEASDLAQMPDRRTLDRVENILEQTEEPQFIEFPSSGSIMPPSWSQAEADGILDTCRWIYELANPKEDESGLDDKDCDGDSIMACRLPSPYKVLIHCTDGYTESSLLALAYYMYAEGVPVHEAWLQLHCDKGRNFFAYASDVALLSSIQPRILQESPHTPSHFSLSKAPAEPAWLSKMDGSLPSRILPYMYLGNLCHANNPELLRAIGIRRVLSVGEAVSWSAEEREKWGEDNILFVDRVQDNGVDPLMDEFDRCLSFIESGKLESTATLVHCRVGVSRSATICIAEVMNSMGLSFPRAYCFVRARRLNVIIQPHLRFSYELLKWEEHQQQKRGVPLKRELEWATIAREIALMNRPYSR